MPLSPPLVMGVAKANNYGGFSLKVLIGISRAASLVLMGHLVWSYHSYYKSHPRTCPLPTCLP